MMKRCLILLFSASLVLIFTAPAGAFSPTPSDLYGLDHHYYYEWGISLPESINPGSITSASFTIDNINNWRIEPDILYINLLDLDHGTVKQFYDGQVTGNAFGPDGLLATFTDENDSGGINPPEDFTYNFSEADLAVLRAYAADGLFGFGLDPDCHYWNEGISFNVGVATPEPATLALLGFGLIGFAAVGRRRIKG